MRIRSILILPVVAIICLVSIVLRSSFASPVTNSAPIAVNDSYTVHAGMLMSVTSNDSDPDHDNFTIQSYTWPQHGSIYKYDARTFSYTTTANGYVGSDSFTYTICDSFSNCSSPATVTVNIVNQPPVANTDNYTVHGGLLFSPKSNDTDPDGDSTTFQSIVTYPQHGNLTPWGGGSYQYTPVSGYVGSDSWTYSIKDSLGLVSIGTVNFTVANQLAAIADFYVVHTTYQMNLMENDFDPDGDSVTFQGIATQPQNGWLQGVSGGVWKYFPNSGFSGFDSFSYTIRDSLGLTKTAMVYVLVEPQETPNAPYGCSCPADTSYQGRFNPSGGALSMLASTGENASGPQYKDPVNLATGRENYTPDPDLSIYNPNGPSVLFQRSYVGAQVVAEPRGYGSPGLSRGWVHNYDVSLQGTSGSWGALKLMYPNGATENLTPQLSGGSPTGAFNTVAGAPYIVSGVAGSPAGTWQSVTITWNDQTQWKFTLLSGTTYALNHLTNRTGQSLNFSWNTSRALTQVSDAATSTALLTLAYSSNGKLSTATDTYGRQVAYTFSPGNETVQSALTTVSQVVTAGTSNPAAHWTYTYDITKGQQLNTITVPSPTGSGNSTATINYNSVGKVSSLVDANGNQHAYTYNSSTTQVQVKDSANNVALAWTQKFNSSGLDTGITDAATHSSTTSYTDSANPLKPTSVADRNNHTTLYTYDSFGNVLTVTSPRNVTTTYTWSYTNFALGRLMSIQEGTKPQTSFSYYEPSGLIQTITRPEPNNGAGTTSTSFTYDTLGNLLTVTTPGNDSVVSITTTLNYTTDGGYSQSAKVGQPLTVTDNLGHTTHLRYDSQGRTISVTDAIGNETGFSYNLVGQPLTTTYPTTGQTGSGNSHSTNAYFYVGGPLATVTVYDESNMQVRQVTHAYGPEGESLSISGSTEPATKTYDALYRLKTLKDGNNNATTYSYNNLGFVASITMPGGEATQFTSYDNAGNLLQRIDGNNVTTNYVYNDLESFLTDIQYPATTSLNIHFTYDGYGRRSGMIDGTGSNSYSYGNLSELLSTTTTYTGLSAKTISYSYFANGSRATMTTPAGTLNYSYDAAGRPSSMTNPFSETTSWSYQNNNWLQTQTLANGATATYAYNAMGQVTRLLNQIGSATISDFSGIAYDGVGNRTSVTASIPGATSLDGTTGYTYDSQNQLTQEASTRNGGFTDSFSYDSAANPISFKGVTKTYNSNNQQTGTGFAYDGNGNPTTYSGTQLTFDPENRMTAFSNVLTAAYNGEGLRTWKQNAISRIYFLYDGVIPVVEFDATGAIISTNTFGAAGLISRRDGSSSVFYTFDSEANVCDRSDASGIVLASHLFSAFGTSLTTSSSDPFGYKAQVGYYTDNETGLQNLTYRYYNQSTGRFLTPDPIGQNGGINVYSYVRNNPLSYADPLGLAPEISEHWRSVGGDLAAALFAFIQDFCTEKGDGPYVIKLDLPPGFDSSDGPVTSSPFGDGACMQLVQIMLERQGTPLGPAGFGRLKQGPAVMGIGGIRPGTVIASGWRDGYYPNYYPHGNHAAIYLRSVPNGFVVLEQVNGHLQVDTKIAGVGGYYSNANAYNVVLTGQPVAGVPARQRYP